MDDDKVKLGVLWKNISRKGNKPYLSGRVQQDTLDAAVRLLRAGGRLLILSNTKRPDKQDPDCVLFVVPERETHDGTHASDSATQGRVPAGTERSAPRTSAGGRGPR
jgi:hypothetical protein